MILPSRLAALLLLLAVASLPGPSAAAEPATVRTLLEVESELLARALHAYGSARAEERAARQQVDELASRLDGQVREGGRPAETEDQLAAARERETAAAARVAALRQRIAGHRERLALLQERSGETLVPRPDVLSGRWRIVFDPGGEPGLMELTLDGARVSGTYRLENGGAGSLAGTFAGGRIRLERVDADAGLDAVLQGTYDSGAPGAPGNRRLRGTWQPTIVSGGGPGGGSWEAVPAPPAAN